MITIFDEKPEDPTETVMQTISEQNHAGLAYFSAGLYSEAEASFLKLKALLESEGDSEKRNLMTVLHNLGEVYYAQQRYAEAEQYYQRSLALRRRMLGPNHLSVASGYYHLAKAQMNRKDYHLSESLFKEAIKIMQTYSKEHPLKLANAINQLGAQYYQMGEFKKAETQFIEAIHTLREEEGDAMEFYLAPFEEEPPYLSEFIIYYTNLGRTQVNLGAIPSAKLIFENLVRICKQADLKQEMVLSLSRLAKTQLSSGDTSEALHTYKQALQEAEKHCKQATIDEIEAQVSKLTEAS